MYADDRPVDYKDVMATLYRNVGLDTAATTIPGPNDRPVYLLQGHEPVKELVG